MSREFEGVRAIVTGGSNGIGAAIVTALAERGAKIVNLDLKDSDSASNAHFVEGDLTTDSSVRSAINLAAEHLGGIDILINNAGIGTRGRLEDNEDSEWATIFDVNVMGIVRASRAALPLLRKSTYSAIVNTCSIAGWAGIKDRAVYSASKGAVQALTLSMAADYVAEGIRVNAVNPGTVDTLMARGHINSAQDPAEALRAMEERQATGRMVSAHEVAHAVCYLASPLASATTGTILAVDGGMYGLRVAGTSQSHASLAMPEWLRK